MIATIFLSARDLRTYVLGFSSGTLVVFAVFWCLGWRSPRVRQPHTVPLVIETDGPDSRSRA